MYSLATLKFRTSERCLDSFWLAGTRGNRFGDVEYRVLLFKKVIFERQLTHEIKFLGSNLASSHGA